MMKTSKFCICTSPVTILAIGSVLIFAHIDGAGAVTTDYENCLLDELRYAGDTVTAKEIRDRCKSDFHVENSAETPAETSTLSAVDERLLRERETKLRPWVLTPHKPNYILPISYNPSPYEEPYAAAGNEIEELDDVEFKFQLSFKVPLAVDLMNDRVDIIAAYTNTSWWQAYNRDHSSPFRETNHEPELFLTIDNDWKILGFRNRINVLGISHQSNGRARPLSRSWNRIYATMILERGGLGIGIKPWIRIKENDDIDNNPDITKYLGYGDLTMAYKTGRQTLSMKARKKSVELAWSRLAWGNIRFYAQYFYGYGQSLIEYDTRSSVLGFGVAFSDWL
jgi:phospholipase A1